MALDNTVGTKKFTKSFNAEGILWIEMQQEMTIRTNHRKIAQLR